MTERRNPARDLEDVSRQFVKAWTNGSAVVSKIDEGDVPDFRIDYHDGRIGLGEVKAELNPNYQGLWAAIEKQGLSRRLELAPGLGVWSCQISRTAHIGSLKDALPKLIDALFMSGSKGLDIVRNWPRGDIPDLARRIGVNRLHRYSEMPGDYCTFFVEGGSGVVPVEQSGMLPWIEEFFGSDRFQRSWDRLENSECDERHVFVWLAENIPQGLQSFLMLHSDSPPSNAAPIPSWVTHLWLGIPSSFLPGQYAWLFQRDIGWQVRVLPSDPVLQTDGF